MAEGQTLSDIYIPVRLKIWENPILIHKAKDPASGVLMESAEIQGSQGQKLFAIEDGRISFDRNENRINLVSADITDGGRIWAFLNVALTATEGDVLAGDEIGTILGSDLVFFVMDDSSPVVPRGLDNNGQEVEQMLPANPILALDKLDPLPLPQDQGKLLTQAEAKRLSERLTDGGADIGKIAIVSGIVLGTGLVTALAVKALSK